MNQFSTITTNLFYVIGDIYEIELNCSIMCCLSLSLNYRLISCMNDSLFITTFIFCLDTKQCTWLQQL